MANNTRLESNLHVVGRITAETMTIPASTIVDAGVSSDAAIAASKLIHRFPVTYAQNESAVVSDAVQGIHVAAGAGTITAIEVVCTSSAPVGDSTVTVDLLRSTAGGAYATVLSSVVTVDNSTTVRTIEPGTINTSDYIDGDSFTLDVNATVGTGTLPTGLLVTVFFEESP